MLLEWKMLCFHRCVLVYTLMLSSSFQSFNFFKPDQGVAYLILDQNMGIRTVDMKF